MNGALLNFGGAPFFIFDRLGSKPSTTPQKIIDCTSQNQYKEARFAPAPDSTICS